MKKILLILTCIYVNSVTGQNKKIRTLAHSPIIEDKQIHQESKLALLQEIPLDLTLTTASPVRPTKILTDKISTNHYLTDEQLKAKIEQFYPQPQQPKCKLDQIIDNQKVIIALLGIMAAKIVIYDLMIANKEK